MMNSLLLHLGLFLIWWSMSLTRAFSPSPPLGVCRQQERPQQQRQGVSFGLKVAHLHAKPNEGGDDDEEEQEEDDKNKLFADIISQTLQKGGDEAEVRRLLEQVLLQSQAKPQQQQQQKKLNAPTGSSSSSSKDKAPKHRHWDLLNEWMAEGPRKLLGEDAAAAVDVKISPSTTATTTAASDSMQPFQTRRQSNPKHWKVLHELATGQVVADGAAITPPMANNSTTSNSSSDKKSRPKHWAVLQEVATAAKTTTTQQQQGEASSSSSPSP